MDEPKKKRKYKRSCRIISIAAKIAYSKKRSKAERIKELKELEHYISSLIASVEKTG